MAGCKLYYHFPGMSWFGLNIEYVVSCLYEIWEDRTVYTVFEPFGLLLGISIGPLTASIGVLSLNAETDMVLTFGVLCPIDQQD